MSRHYVRSMLKGGCRVLTYCGYEGGIEGVLAEPEQQTCLADPAVSDEQQLEEVIVRFRHLNKLQSPTFRQYKAAMSRNPPSGNPQPASKPDRQQTGAEKSDVNTCFALWST